MRLASSSRVNVTQNSMMEKKTGRGIPLNRNDQQVIAASSSAIQN